MIGHSHRLALVLTLLGLGFLGGCADSGFPKVSDFGRIAQKVLTPQEQQQAIKGMTDEHQAKQSQAIKEIEQKKPN